MKEFTPKDSHYARLRRQFRDINVKANVRNVGSKTKIIPEIPDDRVRLYGLHTVEAAIHNKRRKLFRLLATKNALPRLGLTESDIHFSVEVVEPKVIDSLVGADAIHQGVMLETAPLKPRELKELTDTNLLIILDQITDPHNVGAIMRSAVAFDAGALITTSRHSPHETGVLAKSASGALELIELISVRNLAEAIQSIQALGFRAYGLDSEGTLALENALSSPKIALVLGAEGKGLRQKTRETVDVLTRLSIPGKIRSLNVSNAAAIALYSANLHLAKLLAD